MRMSESIKCSRRALGLTQAEFATAVGVSANTISAFETGKEVSSVVFNMIKIQLKNYVSALPPEKYFEYQIVRRAYSMEFADAEEKKQLVNHIMLYCAKFNLEPTEK